jgi:MFS family permease
LLLGAALMPIGALAFAALTPASSILVACLGSIVMGLGMGLLSTTAVVIIQESVGWAERGSATASNIFSRNLGSTLGATMLGGILNLSLARRHGGAVGVSYDQIRQLLDHPRSGAESAVQIALGGSLHLTFLTVLGLALLTLLLATLIPAIPLRTTRQTAAAD